MDKKKRRWGDRKDGVWIKNIDSMHKMAPYLLRKRADREAFIEETIDLTNIKTYLSKKNSLNPASSYTIFQVISSSIIKTVTLRPHLNRFIAGRRIYQRNNVSLAFIAKNSYNDDSDESLVLLNIDPDNTIDKLHANIEEKLKKLRQCRNIDNSTAVMNMLTKMPRPILALVSGFFLILDYFGRVPFSLIKEDPNYASIYLSNLGSIRLNSAYHHLNNWGTNSLFIVIGEYGSTPFFDKQGNIEMRDSLKIGITLDEMISDGYYYAKSFKLFKYLLEHPENLEIPTNEEVIYEQNYKNPLA